MAASHNSGSSKSTDADKQRLAELRMHAHFDWAEYWLQKNDLPQARAAVKQVGSDLAFLASISDALPDATSGIEASQLRWQALARRAGVAAKPILVPEKIDLSQSGREPLTGLNAADMSGHHWTVKDFNGKIALITTWATWCAPCRAELPYIQKLQESFRGRTDRLVITIDIDSSEELTRKFIQEYKYTFPVIRSVPLATRINFAVAVPQNRLVDSKAQLLAQPIEFNGEAFLPTLTDLMHQLQ